VDTSPITIENLPAPGAISTQSIGLSVIDTVDDCDDAIHAFGTDHRLDGIRDDLARHQ